MKAPSTSCIKEIVPSMASKASPVWANFNAGRRLLLSSTLVPFSTIHTSTILLLGRQTYESFDVLVLQFHLSLVLCSTISSFFPLQKWKSRNPCHQLCVSCRSLATFYPFEWLHWQNGVWGWKWTSRPWISLNHLWTGEWRGKRSQVWWLLALNDEVAICHIEGMKADFVNPIQFTQSDHKAVKLHISH